MTKKKQKPKTHRKTTLMEIFRNFSAPIVIIAKADNTVISETGEITESFDPSGPKTMHIPNSWFFRMGDTKNGKLLKQNLSILNLSLFLFIPQSPSGSNSPDWHCQGTSHCSHTQMSTCLVSYPEDTFISSESWRTQIQIE